MESQGRGSLSPSGGRGGANRDGPPSGPLYKRLPPGPHRLAPSEVIRHQRLRIHGAMIESVAHDGYDATSVKQVVALAGVSRRSFYELFANKQACFLVTFDVIAQRELRRLGDACRDGHGDRDASLGAVFARLARDASEDRDALALALLAAPCAGAPGTLRLRRAIGACGQMFARSLGDPSAPGALPAPIVAGVAGGLHGALAAELRDPRPIDRLALSETMLAWALPFTRPLDSRLAGRMAAQFKQRMRERSHASAVHTQSAASSDDARRRALASTLAIAARDGYEQLSGARIADESGLPCEQVRDLCGGPDRCFVAAIEMIGEDLLELVPEPAAGAADWPRAVRHALAAVMSRLDEEPSYAHALGQEAFCAGQEALERALAVTRALAAALLAGAPADARGERSVECVAGTFAHALRSQVAGGRVELLPALADYLCFVVLTPSIGAAAAGDLLGGEQH